MILGQLIAQLQNKQNNFEKRLAQLESAVNASAGEKRAPPCTDCSSTPCICEKLDSRKPTADVGASKAFKECGRCRFPQECYMHCKCRDDYYREQSSGPADGHIAQAKDIHEPLAPVGVVEQPRQGKVVGSNPSVGSAGSVHMLLRLEANSIFQRYADGKNEVYVLESEALSHLAAQQAEIERLQKRAEGPEHDWLLLLQQSTMRLQEIHILLADNDRLARELEGARQWQKQVMPVVMSGARHHAQNCVCIACEALAAMPTEKL